MPNLRYLTVRAVIAGASDPAGGLCGISGPSPKAPVPHNMSLLYLDLSYNQLTGQMPGGLLSLARVIDLKHNKFTGAIPGHQARKLHGPQAKWLDLSDNLLEASLVHEPWLGTVRQAAAHDASALSRVPLSAVLPCSVTTPTQAIFQL